MTVQMFYNLQNHPIFHSEERLVNLARRRECLVGLSLLLYCGVIDSLLQHHTHCIGDSNPVRSIFLGT